jgi:uncharacterized protein YjbJ (UPF0337 family)
MNSSQVNAKVDEVVGSIKRNAGKVTGNTPLQVKGIAQQTKGKLEGVLGAAKDKAKNVVRQANQETKQGSNRKARKQQDMRP